MATRTALLNGNVINRDTDFSKHIEAVSEPWVISWFAVSSSSVAVWQALVKCERTNGDIIYAVVYNNSAQEISWNGDVFIEIAQELIDNGELMNEDWSEIAEIKVGTMPAKNALKLAVKSWSTITDARNIIKKSGELLALINQNIEDIEDLDDRVEALEEAGAINHLEESWIVGELYSLNDKLFKQNTPKLSDSTLNVNVWDTNSNKQIHIQRIASWTAGNTLKLKVKKVWSPTTNLIVEVRKWTEVDVSSSEAYRYWWGNLIASWSIAYWDVGTSYAEKTITLNNNFWWTKGELLDIVIYQTDNIVNASNYYVIACDSKQFSEWFSYVAVNGDTRVRSKLMPYCLWTWLSDSLFAKIKTPTETFTDWPKSWSKNWSSWRYTITSWTMSTWWVLKIEFDFRSNGASYWYAEVLVEINWREAFSPTTSSETNIHRVYDAGYRPAWTTYAVKIQWSASNAYCYMSNCYIRIFDYQMDDSKQSPVLPREIKSIWETTFTTLYWTHTDNIFYGMKPEWYSSNVSSWSITLPNAQWYITVRIDWVLKKIPYYNV